MKNERLSHGFIKIKGKINPLTKPGSMIVNTAGIIFDFNDPVITNTVRSYFLCQDEYVTITDTICQGEKLYGYHQSGTYFDEFTGALGCDSTRVLRLTVLPGNDPKCMETSVNSISSGRLKVWPNPVKDILFIDNESVELLNSVEVLDLHGKQLLTLDKSQFVHKIDLSHLNSGTYFLKCLSDEGSVYINKLVKL